MLSRKKISACIYTKYTYLYLLFSSLASLGNFLIVTGACDHCSLLHLLDIGWAVVSQVLNNA